MTTTLEISTNVKFASVAEARIAGQAIEQFLGVKGQNGVRLYSYEKAEGSKRPGRRTHPLYLPEPSDNVTRGRQEVETRLMNLLKNVRSGFGDLLIDAELSEGVMKLDSKQWVIDYQQLFDNVANHVEKAEAKEPFNAAVALTLQQELTGRIR